MSQQDRPYEVGAKIKGTHAGGRLLRHRAFLERFRTHGSCLPHVRLKNKLAEGKPVKNKAAGRALIERKQRLSTMKYPPLKPRPPIAPKDYHRMNVATISTPLQEVTPEQMADLRDRIRAVTEVDKTYSQSRIAKEADVSTATLSQFLGGTYAGNQQNIARKLGQWLKAIEERAATGKLPEGPAWVATPTSERITTGLRYAQMAGDVVLIVGGAGLGKTKTIDRYSKSMPNVWHVELTPATGSVLQCLQEIALALGLRDLVNNAAFLQRAIFGRVRDTNGLLILDEAQHLNIQALDQVRAINDQTGIGLVLCGNERVYTQMSGGNRAPFLDRLHSRIGKKIVLKKATAADADAIIAAWGIDDGPCRDAIRQIASTPGALRVLNKVLRLAATYAKAKGRKICCDEIGAAARELGVMV